MERYWLGIKIGEIPVKILQVDRNRIYRLLDVDTPAPGPGEVLMRVDAVTTCPQWDLHLRHDEPMFIGHTFHYPYTPGQPGHEASGVVEAVGDNVTHLHTGDRISAWRDPGHDRPGCYAQYSVLNADHVIHVPSRLSAEATAPVELAMCVGSSMLLLRRLDALSGKRVGVMGLGPAGLVAIQMARAEGASSVIGFDLSPQRRALAVRCGADAAYDTRTVSDAQIPYRWTKPVIDTAIDCVGAAVTVEWIMDRTLEVVALFGVQREAYRYQPHHYSPPLLLCGYPGHHRDAAEYAVSLIASGLLDLMPLITHRLPLDRYGDGIDLLERQEAVKVCFFPWECSN